MEKESESKRLYGEIIKRNEGELRIYKDIKKNMKILIIEKTRNFAFNIYDIIARFLDSAYEYLFYLDSEYFLECSTAIYMERTVYQIREHDYGQKKGFLGIKLFKRK